MTRYRCTLLRAGRLLLDGGGMFGLIPRVVWSRAIEPDDHHRITLHHNCLLLESVGPDPELGRSRRVLIETGTGDKLDEKMSAIFGLDGATSESAVADAGVDPASIDDVIVSHLHFDHAGGLTRRCRDGEAPDWVATERVSGVCPEVKLTYPNARVHVQRREWADAIANNSVMTRTYYQDHLRPLEIPLGDGAARLRLADCPQPFCPGVPVDRDGLPRTSVEARWREIVPGIRVFLTPGHTWGQQAVAFTDERDRNLVFTPDLMPSRHHVGAAYSLAYDVEPYTTMITKRWFLAEAADRGWLLVLDHEPDQPLQRVSPTDRGWFELHGAEPEED